MMTLAERLKQLRRELGFSQEAVGAQGFVSTPGRIKIENGQRQASEKLIANLVAWLVEDKHVRAGASRALQDELLTLKYLGNRSAFVREMAKSRALALPGGRGSELLKPSTAGKPKRGRPAMAAKA